MKLQLVPLLEYSVVSKALCVFFIKVPITCHCHSTGCAWTFRKSKCWKALNAPGERSPLNLFSLLVTFLIKGLTNDIQEG